MGGAAAIPARISSRSNPISTSPDYAYADYGAAPDPSHRPMFLDAVLGFLAGLPSGARVLDAGCGGGDFSIGLGEAGFAVCGCDLNASGVQHAGTLGIGEFRLHSLYEDLAAPFGGEPFDGIVCVEVIEHLYSPQTFARRAYAALRPGGVLVITTPYWGWLKNVVLALTGRMDRSLTALWEGGHIKHFSRATLTALMAEAGFETLGFRGCSEGWRRHVPYLWSGMAMGFRRPA